MDRIGNRDPAGVGRGHLHVSGPVPGLADRFRTESCSVCSCVAGVE